MKIDEKMLPLLLETADLDCQAVKTVGGVMVCKNDILPCGKKMEAGWCDWANELMRGEENESK